MNGRCLNCGKLVPELPRESQQLQRDANKRKWTDPQFASKMSESRKTLWSNPVYRAKMLEVRRVQGQKLRQKNLTKKGE